MELKSVYDLVARGGNCGEWTRDRVASLCVQARERGDPQSFALKQLERYASCRMVPRPTRNTSNTLRLIADTHAFARRERKRRKMQKIFATTTSGAVLRDNCGGFCEHDNQCMAAGCTTRPSHTQTLGGAPRFRCLRGTHLCHKHAMFVNSNNGRSKATLMKDGRSLDSVYLNTPESEPSESGSRARRVRSHSKVLEKRPFDANAASLVKLFILEKGTAWEGYTLERALREILATH
jgi:hypothetical protein